MKNIICVLAVVCGVASPVLAQELRKPTDVTVIKLQDDSPGDLAPIIDEKGRLNVWFYSKNLKLSNRLRKFQIYENSKVVKEINNLNEIPQPETVGISIKRPELSSTTVWHPFGGANDYEKKITFEGMVSLGFSKDKFILGPFSYDVVWASPIGFDKAGFMYIVAECEKERAKAKKGQYELRRFKFVYKINKEAKIIDSFIFDEAKHVDLGKWTRYPWEWSLEGTNIDENGNFYTTTNLPYYRITTAEEYKPKYTEVEIRKWGLK